MMKCMPRHNEFEVGAFLEKRLTPHFLLYNNLYTQNQDR